MTALRKWLSMTFLPSSTSRVLALFCLLTCWRIENGKGFNINSLSDFAFCQTKATLLGTMVKYFNCAGFLKATWDQVSQAFWERYPNPYSNHVLTEDIIFREVTPDNCLISRRLLTKTSRAPRWAEKFLPSHMARKAYIIEDSVVDPQKRSLVTFTWNISHARFMSVEERCVYTASLDNSNLTEVKREAWISSNLYGFSRAVQEFGLARFKSSVVKTMKGFDYVLARMQGETPTRTLAETATEKARETALAAKEKAKGLASQAQKKQYV